MKEYMDFENISNNGEQKEENIIKHIVISGGGVTGLAFYGALRDSNKKGIWNINNIKTIYGTSVGSLVATIISLKFDWDTLDDYIIKRPWQNVYKFKMEYLLYVFQTKGLLDIKIIEDTFSPLFRAKDISINVTLKEFFEITNIELHFMSIDINTFNSVDFSYKTHPEWRVIDVLYCSCSLPVLFQPIIKDGICYCDGGFISNYAINDCINNGANPNEIFGLCKKSVNNPANNVSDLSTLMDFLFIILYKIVDRVLNNKTKIVINKEIFVDCPPISIYDIYNTASSMEERLRLIEIGSETINNICYNK